MQTNIFHIQYEHIEKPAKFTCYPEGTQINISKRVDKISIKGSHNSKPCKIEIVEQDGKQVVKKLDKPKPKRRKISTFSKHSRRRLVQMMGTLKKRHKPLFVTLTYPEVYPEDIKTAKEHLNTFWKRFIRRFPGASMVWKLEPQKRGAPHYHLLVWGVDLIEARNYVPYAWVDVTGSDDENHLLWHLGKLGHGNKPCVEEIYSWNGVVVYASKYMGKDVESKPEWKNPGRFWGVKSRENMPYSEVIVFDNFTDEQADRIMLYMLSIIADADYREQLASYNLSSLTLNVPNPIEWFSTLDL
jgi:hypothetical protein